MVAPPRTCIGESSLSRALPREWRVRRCINDSDTFISLLTDEFGYDIADIRQLRDDHPQRMPTRPGHLRGDSFQMIAPGSPRSRRRWRA